MVAQEKWKCTMITMESLAMMTLIQSRGGATGGSETAHDGSDLLMLPGTPCGEHEVLPDFDAPTPTTRWKVLLFLSTVQLFNTGHRAD